MFDIGFPELLIVSVVALLVLGPERLPEALRTLGLWIARIRRSFLNVKAEIEREIGADEIRREIYNEQVLEQSSEFKKEIQGIVDDLNQPIDPGGRPSHDASDADDAGAQKDAGAHEDAADEDERTAQEPLSTGPSQDNDHANNAER